MEGFGNSQSLFVLRYRIGILGQFETVIQSGKQSRSYTIKRLEALEIRAKPRDCITIQKSSKHTKQTNTAGTSQNLKRYHSHLPLYPQTPPDPQSYKPSTPTSSQTPNTHPSSSSPRPSSPPPPSHSPPHPPQVHK